MIFDGMDFEQIVETVDEINEYVESQTDDETGETFGLSIEFSSGYCAILLGHYPLWDDNENGREWVDDHDTQEPLIMCLSRRMSEYLSTAGRIEKACTALKFCP